MTNEPSPRPWRAIYARVLDARGKTVCVCEKDSMHGMADDETAKADAALIVDAVNHMDYDLSIRFELNDARAEIDRLRDIVRRLLPLAETTVENIRALDTARFPFEEQIKSDRLRGDIQREASNADHLLREARAAIGEDKP